MSLERSNITFRANRDIWLFSEERKDITGGTRSIIVRELCK